jgi:hypothetical protein
LNNSAERAVLDALRDIKRIADTDEQSTIRRICELIGSNRVSYDRLVAISIASEPPRVRALLGAIGEKIGASESTLSKLRKGLNELTRYHINVGAELPAAAEWNIAV